MVAPICRQRCALHELAHVSLELRCVVFAGRGCEPRLVELVVSISVQNGAVVVEQPSDVCGGVLRISPWGR